LTERRHNRLRRDHALFTQLRWFVGLRWLAGAAVIAGAVANRLWLEVVARDDVILILGLVIVGYNAVLAGWLRRGASTRRHHRLLLALAGAQILLDLTCLVLLVLLTHGSRSPVLGFFVFHMVFASLLLPQRVAYGSAAVAIGGMLVGLVIAGAWPRDQTGTLGLFGWSFTLVMTVFLANHLTLSLKRQRARLARQNRRIRQMDAKLRGQQEAMIQHEKLAAMGQMAAGVSHEIANPLACMDSVLQLMQRWPDRPRPDAVKTLRDQIDRIRQIMQQMSAFAHPGEAEWQMIDLNELVNQAARMARFDRRTRRVTLEVEVTPQPIHFRGLGQTLQQVIVNLLLNAMDAVDQVPQPRVTLRTGVVPGSPGTPGWAVVQVIDNGHGIQPEHLRRIFEPFFTTKPLGRGTGLGLSISFRLVSEHSGHIDVQSRPGEGTIFTVRLPLVPTASRGREMASTTAPISGKPDV
jgi:signal transduction histidine kinase